MSTISVKYCDIPKWLQVGDFYRNLSPDDPDEFITIPAKCFRGDHECKNLNELWELIQVALFWMLDEIPDGMLQLCVKNGLWREVMLSVPGAEESKILAPLIGVYPLQGTIPFVTILATGKLWLIVHAAKQMKDRNISTAVAAQEGNLHALKHLHEQEFEWDEETCWRASLGGHVDCLQYAHEHGCPWDYKVYEYAAQEGHLHIMEYAHQQGLNEWHVDVCRYAALNGQLTCLRFAHEHGCPWDSMAVRNAAQNGHLACLQYLLEQGCPIHEEACNITSMYDHISCLQLLRAYGASCNEVTCAHAAMCSDNACLQYLHENGCPWDERTTNTAAQYCTVNNLRYALDHDCPYAEGIIMFGAMSGSLPCLQYLVEEQGLHMNEHVFCAALLKGNLVILQYLIDQGCPYLDARFSCKTSQVETYDKIFVKNKPEFTQCVQFAVERGWTVDYTFCQYVSAKDKSCVAYLRSEGLFTEKEDHVSSESERVNESIPLLLELAFAEGASEVTTLQPATVEEKRKCFFNCGDIRYTQWDSLLTICFGCGTVRYNTKVCILLLLVILVAVWLSILNDGGICAFASLVAGLFVALVMKVAEQRGVDLFRLITWQ